VNLTNIRTFVNVTVYLQDKDNIIKNDLKRRSWSPIALSLTPNPVHQPAM
jgi:hypothetical protein